MSTWWLLIDGHRIKEIEIPFADNLNDIQKRNIIRDECKALGLSSQSGAQLKMYRVNTQEDYPSYRKMQKKMRQAQAVSK